MYKAVLILGLCFGISSCAHHNYFYDKKGFEIATEVDKKLEGFESSRSPIAGREKYIKNFKDNSCA